MMNASLPVCLCLMLRLLSCRGSGLVHLCVETIQLLRGSLRRVGPCRRASGRGCAADECLRHGWLAEVVDAGVVGIAVIVFEVGKGGGVRGEVARADLCVPWIIAVGQRKERPWSTSYISYWLGSELSLRMVRLFFGAVPSFDLRKTIREIHTCHWCWGSFPALLHSEPPVYFLRLCSCPLFSYQTWNKERKKKKKRWNQFLNGTKDSFVVRILMMLKHLVENTACCQIELPAGGEVYVIY